MAADSLLGNCHPPLGGSVTLVGICPPDYCGDRGTGTSAPVPEESWITTRSHPLDDTPVRSPVHWRCGNDCPSDYPCSAGNRLWQRSTGDHHVYCRPAHSRHLCPYGGNTPTPT